MIAGLNALFESLLVTGFALLKQAEEILGRDLADFLKADAFDIGQNLCRMCHIGRLVALAAIGAWGAR